MRALALPVLLVVLVVGALITYSATFIVTERDQAIQMRFGEIQRVITEPGIYFKVPTNVVDTVQIVDKRIQILELQDKIVQVSDSRQYVVDAFTAYRIADARAFRESVSGRIDAAENRLASRLEAALRRVYGSRSFEAALSVERGAMMREVSEFVRPEAANLGIEIVEFRIRRTELPENVLERTFDRMRSERLAEAAELRAEGTQEALRIRAEADRQATVLVAEANRDAEILRGEGDAERNRIFAEAYSLDEDFFEFYRSMQAYTQALGNDTTMVLQPDSEFFRYFGGVEGVVAPGRTIAPQPSTDAGPAEPETLSEAAPADADGDVAVPVEVAPAGVASETTPSTVTVPAVQ